ncbi:MAG: ELWxxDGT repeat protein [Prochloraceae cyanobacterium]
MTKIVELRLDDLPDGSFRVTLEIKSNLKSLSRATGNLPSADRVIELYRQWRSIYCSLGYIDRDGKDLAKYSRDSNSESLNRAIVPKKIVYGGSIETSIQECDRLSKKLGAELSRWLLSRDPGGDFLDIEKQLRQNLKSEEEISFLICTPSQEIRRLPWHLWDLLDRYTRAEVSLSTIEFSAPPKTIYRAKFVRILAILGNSRGIDIDRDKEQLENLPHTDITFLVEPDKEKLQDYLQNRSWDILFFAGHSKTEGERGSIDLNLHDRIDLKDLRSALKTAVEQGLQLAIFNSCDGLGLAKELEELHIPQTIVMREPVPDRVAQAFLTYFLPLFASGVSLSSAVRAAREQLTALEDRYPCASWLPIICQNPAVEPLTWQELRDTSAKKSFWDSLPLTLAGSAIIALLLKLWKLKANEVESGLDEIPSNLTNVSGTLFFTADDGIHGRELWKSDGTPSATTIVADHYPGRNSSFL